MTDSTPTKERIAKRIARAGLCSRRKAEEWIQEGLVSVNGQVIDSPALNVSDTDQIKVRGKLLAAKEPTQIWMYHKPAGLVTTHADEAGRPTVFENLPPNLPRVISVGRLDLNTEGLLLLTNDGELARFLELPQTGWKRRYRVRMHKTPQADTLRTLKKGITVDGVNYRGIEVVLEDTGKTGANVWATVTLQEGKNREIRNVFEHIGHPVNRLIRVAYGPFQLGNMKAGEVKPVSGKILKNALGNQFQLS